MQRADVLGVRWPGAGVDVAAVQSVWTGDPCEGSRVVSDAWLLDDYARRSRVVRELPWIAHAACRGVDPNLFHPERGQNSQAAKSVCRACEVREECLEYALKYERIGVWGGTTEAERKVMRRTGTTTRDQKNNLGTGTQSVSAVAVCTRRKTRLTAGRRGELLFVQLSFWPSEDVGTQ